jgi:P27 family predicted phage terminase small subunit
MSGPRKPIELVVATGKKNLTKAEIKERLETEVKPVTDNITAPSYLTKKQKDEFTRIALQLQKLKIMGETDVDALARYIVANDFYINAVKQLRKTEVKNNPDWFEKWSKIQERYFKQCRSSANDLGLSISSRCKLVVPVAKEPPKKENKFSKFEKRPAVNG